MRTLLLLVLLPALALLATAVVLAIAPPGSAPWRAVARDLDALPSTVPNPGARERAARRAAGAARLAPSSPAAQVALAAAGVRASFALAALPLLGSLFMVGVLAGLLRRQTVRDDFVTPSVTAAYAGKVALVGALVLYLATGLSPLGPPVWTLYAWSGTAAVAAWIYFGNLPPKI